MRMSRRLGMGGKKKVLCTFLGAPGETFTIKQNGSIIHEDITGEVELKQGVYEVIGSISGHKKEIAAKKTGEYAVYPDGAIYWYGREIYAMTTSLDQGYGSAAATENTNHIDLYGWGNSNVAATSSIAQTVTAEMIDASEYSKIHYEVTVDTIYEKYSAGIAQIGLGYRTDTGYALIENNLLTAVAERQTYSVDAPAESVYIGVQARGAWNGQEGNYQARCYVHAIWLE